MTLSTGSRLGPYEITAKLGEGGMGVVFQAKDFHLGREVALKVLPEAFTADPERTARFEREAKLLAQLNHPNIAQIHGLEIQGDTRALVMELVAGPTLDERLGAGSLPLEESLSIARQIAAALEEAHEKGIIHRDLKPQNVKASIEGKVKVLDFGLAKAMDPVGASGIAAASASQLAASPTLTLGATVQGVILGTAAYMSPEQAKGIAVDKRADIWAFGVVLYEMLTGTRLFDAPTVPETLAQVLTRAPDLDVLPASTPAALRRLLRRCLERNPRNRLHDIADARIVLDEVAAGRGDDDAGVAVVSTPQPAWRRALPWALAVAGVGWGVWTSSGGRESARPATGASPVAFTVPWRSAAEGASLLRSVTLSRDGRRLVIWDEFLDVLQVRDLDSFTSRDLPGTTGAVNPFLSPDGEWIGFAADGELKKVALAGGNPVKLCDTPEDTPGGAWGPDGFVYYTPSWASGLWRVPESGGKLERFTQPDRAQGESFHMWPSFLPDGKTAVFTIVSGAGLRDAKLALLDLASGEVTPLVAGAAGQYVGSGHLVFFRHGTWFAAPFDAGSRKLVGPERRVLAEARPLSSLGGRERVLSFADDGRLAYIADSSSFYTPYTQLAWIDRRGKREPLPFEGQHTYNSLDLSPDGRRAAVTLSTEGEVQVWVYDLERGTRERLTRDGQNLSPSWLPDGTRLSFTGMTRGNFDLRVARADGGAPPDDLVTTDFDDTAATWTPDGRGFVYTHSSPETGFDLWTRDLDDDGPGRPLVVTPGEEREPRLSPDGRWLLFLSQGALYVTDFPAATERTLVLADSRAATWSPSTPELFAIRGDDVVAIRYEVGGGRFRPLESTVLFAAPRLPIRSPFAVSNDAQRLLFFVPVPGKTLEPEVRVTTDGFAELRAAKGMSK